MDLDRLYQFVLIAEKRSIKGAAEQLKISPATLSSRLHTFEAYLGVTLFERGNNSFTLTDDGVRFLQSASEISEDFASLRKQLSYFSQMDFQTIRIGIAGTNIPLHLGPFLDIINRNYPQIHIELWDDNVYSLDDGLHSGDVDLYFAPVMSHIQYDDIVRYSVASPHSNIVVPQNHRLAQNNSISMKDLDGETFILYAESKFSCIRDFQLKNITSSVRNYKLYESHSSQSFCKFLTPVGKGILLTPFREPEDLPLCVTLPISDLPYPAQDSVFYLKKPYRKEVKDFINGYLTFAKETAHHEH